MKYEDKVKEFELYKKSCKYNDLQLLEIYKGIMENVDYKMYADPSLTNETMEQYRLALIHKIDIHALDNEDYTTNQQREIRLARQEKIFSDVIENPLLDHRQMAVLRLAVKQGIDITKVANPNYSWQKMALICYAKQQNLNIDTMLTRSPNIGYEALNKHIEKMLTQPKKAPTQKVEIELER